MDLTRQVLQIKLAHFSKGVLSWLIVALTVAAHTVPVVMALVAALMVTVGVATAVTGCAIVVVSTIVDDTSNKPLP